MAEHMGISYGSCPIISTEDWEWDVSTKFVPQLLMKRKKIACLWVSHLLKCEGTDETPLQVCIKIS
jgi:hypothetical protein